MKGRKHMITVNTRNLVEAVREAGAFKLPEMSEGTGYLFDNLYMSLSRGEDVTLSSLDFNAFGQEDVEFLDSLYSDVFERNCHEAGGIASALRETVPVCKAVVYV
jgi:hypothetical protein